MYDLVNICTSRQNLDGCTSWDFIVLLRTMLVAQTRTVTGCAVAVASSRRFPYLTLYPVPRRVGVVVFTANSQAGIADRQRHHRNLVFGQPELRRHLILVDTDHWPGAQAHRVGHEDRGFRAKRCAAHGLVVLAPRLPSVQAGGARACARR